MALRIAREEVYLLLPLSIDHAMSMHGRKEYSMPVEEADLPEDVLDELKDIGPKAVLGGLVVIDEEIDSFGLPTVDDGFYVAYSVRCGLFMKEGKQHIRLSHIEPVDFNLYWKNGKFYQQNDPEDCDMGKPTNVQMAFFDRIASDLVSRHGITKANLSQANPFLMAFLIPMDVEEAKVCAFANDLFHALHVLPEDGKINIGEANLYCGLDADREMGNYLVIFNHPAIFDYPEDSPEGCCAYGVWKQ